MELNELLTQQAFHQAGHEVAADLRGIEVGSGDEFVTYAGIWAIAQYVYPDDATEGVVAAVMDLGDVSPENCIHRDVVEVWDIMRSHKSEVTSWNQQLAAHWPMIRAHAEDLLSEPPAVLSR